MECERSNPSDALRQGDIVAAHPSTNNWNNPWTRFGVILSADCDLAQGKTGPNLAYLPIVSFHTYLADIWLPVEAARLADRGRQSIEKALTEFDSKLSYRHIENWGEAGGSENISGSLEKHLRDRIADAKFPKKREEIVSLWECVRSLDGMRQIPSSSQTDNVKDLLSRLATHRAIVERTFTQTPVNCQAMIEKALLALQDRLDAWLIRELINLDPEMTHPGNMGFVIPLRSFSVLPVGVVKTTYSEWLKDKSLYYRVCRLRGIYKADLVQKFANLFVRVGLEDHRDEEQRRMFQRCAKDLFP